MSKRPGGPVIDGQSSKRHRIHQVHQDAPTGRGPVDDSTQALLRIAEKADELIECLQNLKNLLPQSQGRHTSNTSQTSTSISRICKQILPSVELLGSLDDNNSTLEQAAVDEKKGMMMMKKKKKNEEEEEAEEEEEDDETKKGHLVGTETDQEPNGPPIPSFISVTPWTSSEIKPGRPELPAILDPGLAEEAFTHPGLGLRFSYERLEWLGDAYLELISSALIHETFGQLPSGRCSQLRERLIRNVSLAEFFRHYGMQRFARLPSDFADGRGLGRGKSCDKDLLKTQADMFEAYVAAVILSDGREGLSRAIAWLKALWGKTLEEDIRKAENLGRTSITMTRMATMTAGTLAGTKATAGSKLLDATSSTTATATTPATAATNAKTNIKTETSKTSLAPVSSAKEQLAQRIVVRGIALRYKDLPCEKRDKNLNLPLYSIGLHLDGWGERERLLAVGTALNKKEAGQKAAEAMLQNRKLMRVYEEKKRAYMQAREAEAEAEAEAAEGEKEGQGGKEVVQQ